MWLHTMLESMERIRTCSAWGIQQAPSLVSGDDYNHIVVLETRELNVFRVKPNLVKGSGSNRVQLDIPLPTLKLYFKIEC